MTQLMTHTLPLDDVLRPPDVADKAELQRQHKREYSRRYRYEHKEQHRAYSTLYMREYRKKNADWIRERDRVPKRRWYLANRDRVLAYSRIYKKAHPEDPVRKAQCAVEWKRKVKLEVFTHYCGGSPACSWCGYSDLRALTVDHMNGGGSRHRAEIKGYQMTAWLRKNGYPEGYQVLCMNCQFIKRVEEKEYKFGVARKEVMA